MPERLYSLAPITSETWEASCNKCGKPFRSDVKEKAIKKVLDHVKDCGGKGKT
jgi:hypothetical protein